MSAISRDKVDEAYTIAAFAHKEQKRVGGEPYQRHVERVALACANHALRSRMPDLDRARLMATGLLHDSVEDTDVTAEEIAKRVDDAVARNVIALSHPYLADGSVDEDEPDEVYMRRVAEGGAIALIGKRYDQIDNIYSLAQAEQKPSKAISPEQARNNRAFVKKRFTDVRERLQLWREIDPPGAQAVEQALTDVRYLEPLDGLEGIAALDAALTDTPGIPLVEFADSPKGQEFLKTKKIVIAGAPQSGKSVMRELLKQSIRAIPGAPYPYFLTAAPDGEWAGYQESVKNDPEAARRMKEDYKRALKGGQMFTANYVDRISQSVKNLSAPSAPLNFIDIGGKLSAENQGICEYANAAIILCGENAAKVGIGRGSSQDSTKEEMDPREWKKFFASLGIPIIAVMYSDYMGEADVVVGVNKDGVFEASSHYFERGQLDFEKRPGVQALAEFIAAGGVEGAIREQAERKIES